MPCGEKLPRVSSDVTDCVEGAFNAVAEMLMSGGGCASNFASTINTVVRE